jgi:predicted dehydrogenase
MRILIVGLGAAGQRHARNLRRLLGDDVELLAVRRRGGGPALDDALRPKPGLSPEESLGIRVFSDLDVALAESPDGVVVADPTSLHMATATAAVAAGCAVLIEKPLSNVWEGVPAFLSAVEAAKVPVLVGFQMRFHPLIERAREILCSGELGRVISASSTYGEYLPGWHPYEDYRQSYAARKDLGGGVMLTQIHDIDILGWLFGWPSAVYSVGGHLSDLEVDVDDAAVTLWAAPVDGRAIPVHLQQDYVSRPPVRRLDVVTERGGLSLDLIGTALRAWDSEAGTAIEESPGEFDRNQLFLAEMAHFLECIEGRAVPRISATDAAKSLAVALAGLRSQSTGAVERVLYPLSA